MSTALLKQKTLVTFKQTPVHTSVVLNEGQSYRKSGIIKKFHLIIWQSDLQLDNVRLPKGAGLLHQPSNGAA